MNNIYFLKTDEFKLVEENSKRDSNCAYYFELKTSKICPVKPTPAAPVATPAPPATQPCETKSVAGNAEKPNSTPSGLGVFGIICLVYVFFVYLLN